MWISYIYAMILVTGGTGLVGSHLLLRLAEAGEKPRAIFRSAESLKKVEKIFTYSHPAARAQELFNCIDWIQADITDTPSLEKPFYNIRQVYHCAALVSFDTSQDALLRKVNIEGTANVVNMCIKNSIEKLCYVGSIATFDKLPGEKVISETSYWNKELNHSMYAITKYGAEMEVWRASQEGVPIVIVNPGVIIGPGFWDSGTGKIFKKVHSGLDYYIPKITGFVGVWDVVTQMQQLMASSAKNEEYILVAENLSFQQVFNSVSIHLKKPVPTKKLKKWMVTAAWLWQEVVGVFSSREKHLERRSTKSLFSEDYYSSEKIKRTKNAIFEPLDSVIQKTAKHFEG